MVNIATAKQTGSGGTSFEDKVIAYFLAAMLTETAVFGADQGIIIKIDFQARVDGWLFDDAVLTLQSEDGNYRIGTSIKSNRQLTTSGCPSDINDLLWKQYLKVESSIFDIDRDFLLLVEAPIAPSISNDLNVLLQQAAHQNNAVLHKRVLTEKFMAKSARRIYKSFYCPPEIALSHNISEEDTGGLLKRILHLEMDFEKKSSKDESRVIDLCRSSLESHDVEEARQLYKELCLTSRTLASVAGTLDRKQLIRQLRNQFKLKSSPVHQADWANLAKGTEDKLSVIPSRLGHLLSLDRSEYVQILETALDNGQSIIIQGISGSGKTNIAKAIAERKKQIIPVIWLDSIDFDSDDIDRSLKLTRKLTDLIEDASADKAWLFIDGFERLFHERQLQKLAIVIQKTLAEGSGWKIVITCPSDQMDKLNRFFIRFNISRLSFQDYTIPATTLEEKAAICKSYPVLQEILFKESLREVWDNLKLLDKIIQNIANFYVVSGESTLGESHLIDFVWMEEIQNQERGLEISGFLKTMAEQQADHLTIGLNVNGFTPLELTSADSLRRQQFLRINDDKLYFIHDLYSDWARYKLIRSHGNDLDAFLKKKDLTSPLWAKAIRLYGVSLLEQDTTGGQWNTLFSRFNDKSTSHTLVQDLLLESFFFAPDSFSLLTMHKKLLFKDKADLLRRMSTLFLLRATQPDPQIMESAKKLGITEKQATAYGRLPVYGHWPGFLNFLVAEEAIVLEYDIINAVNIASCWLEKTPEEMPFRQFASDLALKAAEKVASWTAEGIYVDDKIETPVFKALLLGYKENTEKVKPLCLFFCKRVRNSKSSVEANPGTEDHGTIPHAKMSYGTRRTPWEAGPFSRVDDSFRKHCLDGRTLLPILRNDPELGSEMLLAVLIEEPAEFSYGSYDMDDYGMVENHEWYPPFYVRGPFLQFLRVAPPTALAFICKLIDFATDRWREKHADSDERQTYIFEIEGATRSYYGDFYVFGWHKDIGTAPHTIVSVLMALEQYFYEKLENNLSIEADVDYLVKNSSSLAIIGLLLTIAKWNVTLLSSILKPFLNQYEFYAWDNQSPAHEAVLGNDYPSSWQEIVKEWRQRPHRRPDLKTIVIRLIIHDANIRKDFIEIRKRWQQELAELSERNYQDIFFYQLIQHTDFANYQRQVSGENIYFEYVEPPDVSAYLKSGREASLENLTDSQMGFRLGQMIEKNTPFNLHDAEILWKSVQDNIGKLDPTSSSHCSGSFAWAAPHTNIFAAIKLLVHHKQVWIALHPEYLTGIQSFIGGLIETQFGWRGRFEQYGTDHDWNILMADIVPSLWKESTGDPLWRKIVAGILLLFNPLTRKQFFAGASKEFKWNDVDFVQTHNLLLQYSGEYYRLSSKGPIDYEELISIRKKIVDAFFKKETAGYLLEWATIRATEEWKPKDTDAWERRTDLVRKKGMSTELLVPIFQNIPPLAGITDTREKEYLLSFLKEGFLQIIYQLGDIKEDSLRIRSADDDFDRIVIRKIASFAILQIENENEQTEFWKPLFNYGYIAPRWISTFCSAFLTNLDSPENHEMMVIFLEKIFTYTTSLPTWKATTTSRFEDFRLCLLGFDQRMADVWKYDYSSFTTKAQNLFKRWFLQNKYNPHAINVLLDFIATVSGKFLLGYGMKLLVLYFTKFIPFTRQPIPGKIWVGNKELDDKLASSLSYFWQYYKAEIKADEELFKQFRELIQYLISMKNVVGIELQNSLLEN